MATAAMSPGYSSPAMKQVSPALTDQERKDVERFVKFFSQKMVQVIVQSRLGEKACTPCKAQPSSDWFNLRIEDISEVSVEIKKALQTLQGRVLSAGHPPLCVEISLKTVEGDSLVLENWKLSVIENTEPVNRITVYSRMSLLLKSIISVSRVTPAHKLSCRQGADTFVLCYRVFCGEPHPLGEAANNCTIGQVETPVGLYTVTLSYRTQLTLSPKDGTMLVKSDHFTPEFSPRLCRADRTITRERGGESSSGSEQATTSDDSQDACRMFANSPPGNRTEDYAQQQQQQQQQKEREREQRFSFDKGPKYGAFADPSSTRRNLSAEFILPDLPVPTFMKIQGKDTKSREHTEASRSPSLKEGNVVDDTTTRSTSSLGQTGSSGEDFVMVESLKTPFAGDGDPSQDVGAFFRECQSAPLSLQSFSRPGSGVAAQEIGSQLEQFEKEMQTYDDLVQSLCIDPDGSSKP